MQEGDDYYDDCDDDADLFALAGKSRFTMMRTAKVVSWIIFQFCLIKKFHFQKQ